MIFALDSGSEVGQRAARILLADDRCDELLMLNKGWRPSDSRARHARDVSGVDVVLSDGTTPLSALLGRASVAGSPLVAWPDSPSSDLGPASVPVVVGANIGSTLADALVEHPAVEPTNDDVIKVGWTEPGKPLRKGEPLPFPEPVGMAWSYERAPGRFVAHREDQWAGATTVVEGPSGRRIVGVADHGPHLEALVLVAVAIVATSGVFTPGIQFPTAGLPEILAEARNLELDMAVWRFST